MSNSGDQAHKAALAMLDSFASVGAETFDLTLTNAQGKKIGFAAAVPLDQLRRRLPRLLDDGAALQQNVILRPRGARCSFIQLDDLDGAGIERTRPVAFL